ncbi:MAG: hypothetical protein K1W26_08060 [Acetatifactor sp.]
MRRRKKRFWGKIAYMGAFCGIAAILAAVILIAGSPEFWQGDIWNDGEAARETGQEETDGRSVNAPETVLESRILTWQALSDSQDQQEDAAVDYTDPLAWEYCYQYLDEAEQKWYRDIRQVLAGMEKEQELSPEGLEAGLTEEDIDRIFCYVLADHPEYFYVDGYRYTKYSRMDRLVKIEFSGSYTCDAMECADKWEQIEDAAGALLAQAPAGEDDYEKARYVYETLIRNTDYVLDAPDNQNLYSVLVNGASVCQGYAKATQYLLNHLGIPCLLVQGQVQPGEGHAWNMLCLDGDYYYMDTTWGDASYRQAEDDDQDGGWIPQVNYDYLCVTTSQLLRTHTPDMGVPLPECTATRDNYYVREGCLLEDCGEEAIRQAFDRAVAAGRQEISLKCTQESVYRQLLEHLIEDKEVFSYLGQDCSTLHYARNEKQLSVTFWFS